MTLAQYDLQGKWGKPYTRGASQFLDEPEHSQRADFPLALPFSFSGTSSSALDIESYIPGMIEKIWYWEDILERLSGKYQEEIVVFMPPKKQYTVDLEINYLGRAKPFISIDQIDMDLDGD